MGGAAVLTIAIAAAQDRRGRPEPVLYFFFAPDTPGLAGAARAARATGVRVRPVLLATDFTRWPDEFLAAANELGEIAVVDDEGLALARKYGVTRTPCFVYVDGDGAHMAVGTGVDLKEMLSCGRSR